MLAMSKTLHDKNYWAWVLGATELRLIHRTVCAQRGPRCATRLAKHLQEHPMSGAPGPPALYVLRGGFVQFVRMYADEKDLVEDVNPAVWNS